MGGVGWKDRCQLEARGDMLGWRRAREDRIMIKESGANAQTKEVGYGVTRVRKKSG